MAGVGIVNIGLGLKMLFASKNILIVVGAIATGVIIGFSLGLQNGIESFGEWVKAAVGASGDRSFVDVFVGATLLFCVGPMTILGCIQDGLEGKIDLLAVKSVLDGFMAMFFATFSPAGIFATAVVVLVFQSLLTFAAAPLRPVTKDEELVSELNATGGVLLVAIGLGLLAIRKLPVADFLPALIIAPLLVLLVRRFTKKSTSAGSV